jgi:hypothetical protein
MIAIQNQDRQVINELLRAGANADIKDSQGRNSREWTRQLQLPADILQDEQKSL